MSSIAAIVTETPVPTSIHYAGHTSHYLTGNYRTVHVDIEGRQLHRVVIQQIPMSMNKRERSPWATRHREKRTLEHEIGWAMLASRVRRVAPPRIHMTGAYADECTPQRRRVAITVCKSSRGKPDDPANRDSRAKSILDCLVNLGYLVDDSDTWLDWQGVREEIGHDTAHTIIEIGSAQ